MPATNPPELSLRMWLVNNQNNQLGAFGPKFREITRPGLNKIRFQKVAERGARVTITAIQYYATEDDAIQDYETNKDLQGYEVSLTSELTSEEWYIFVYSLSAHIRPVSSTDETKNYRATYQIELELTA